MTDTCELTRNHCHPELDSGPASIHTRLGPGLPG